MNSHLSLQWYRPTYIIAIDLVEIPYHGQARHAAGEIRRGPARSGTQHFHTYASLAVVHDDERYVLALTFVWNHSALVDIVERLVFSARPLGLHIRCAYLDKGFRGVEVLRWLRRHRIPYVIPVVLIGRALLALRTGRKLVWDPRREQVTGDAGANRLVTPTYRRPWKLPYLPNH